MAVVAAPRAAPRLFRRPQATTGWWSWVTTVDHKKIGILYGITSLLFFAAGGIEALLMRAQLAAPNAQVLTADAYNQLFTMHGTTMVFLVIMPLSAAFFNYLVPLMIGARDVAFPRLNAFSYWAFLFGGLFLYSSFFLGGAPDSGWTGYAPLSIQSPGHRMDFWALGLIITGIGSTVSAVNLLVTILNMRAPGMTLMRMPVFVWMTLVVQFLLVFALPVVTIAFFEVLIQRIFGANFFGPQANADPILYQHLFWLFGHPEVYILILPAMGIVSEIFPVFSRKPLFGYPVVVFSGIAIGFMGWGVWAHHMFAAGLGPVANAAFALSTMFIGVPTGVKVFNWLATMWGGSLRFMTPMLFSIGFLTMFIIGGLVGVTHSIVPSDTQQHDTYYIVAHLHYVLFGGSVFGLFAGLYYWYPKVFGRMLREGLGKLHFWLMLIGFNLTFFPHHILGLLGMPRRIYTYPAYMGWNLLNLVSTIGAFTIAVSLLVFIANLVVSRRRPVRAEADPWDARTLEWTTSSPPPAHNFDEIPEVHSVDDFWHRKYAEDEGGKVLPVPAGAEDLHDSAPGQGHAIHMPSPSYFPILAALGLPIIAYGVLYSTILILDGALITLAGVYGWAMEPSAE